MIHNSKSSYLEEYWTVKREPVYTVQSLQVIMKMNADSVISGGARRFFRMTTDFPPDSGRHASHDVILKHIRSKHSLTQYTWNMSN